jgi:hypothetical protein
LADLRIAQEHAKVAEPIAAERRKRIFNSSVGRIQSYPGDE